MITVVELLRSARASDLKAAALDPFRVKGSCGNCGEEFWLNVDRPGRYVFACPGAECQARVEVCAERDL